VKSLNGVISKQMKDRASLESVLQPTFTLVAIFRPKSEAITWVISSHYYYYFLERTTYVFGIICILLFTIVDCWIGGDRLAVRGAIARNHTHISGDNNQKHFKYQQRIAQIANILDLDESIKVCCFFRCDFSPLSDALEQTYSQSLYVVIDEALNKIEGQRARLKTDGMCSAVIFIAAKKNDAPITFKGVLFFVYCCFTNVFSYD
jgi:hypothetical protein